MSVDRTSRVHPRGRQAWRQWLERHHAVSSGVWLVDYKVATGKPRIGYDAAVEEALCFGWIDSIPRALDGERSMLWFAPRKPGTGWSAASQARVLRLEREGRMAPSGQAKVDAARRDGAWSRLDASQAGVVPADLAHALAQAGDAARYFEAFPPSVKRSILEWIGNARRAETRARRVAETASLASINRRANQWRDGRKEA